MMTNKTTYWAKLILAGLAAFVISQVLIFLIVFVYAFGLGFQARGAPDFDQIMSFANAFAPRAGLVLLILCALGAGFLRARRGGLAQTSHGLVLGLAAGLPTLAFGGTPRLWGAALLLLPVAAGWLGAMLGRKKTVNHR